jgi:hypothetical protein
MPENKDLKRLVRERMAATGERYTDALAHIRSQVRLEPLPRGWMRTGDHAADYEVGLLPSTFDHEGARVVRLRLRADVPEPSPGFGALMQTIAATRYLHRKVRFAALIRTENVTGWAGLWLRVDIPDGTSILDNMRDRSLGGTTDWTPAEIVLDVPPNATALAFGVLLSRAGAVDVTRLRLEQAPDDAVISKDALLPEQPQNLDFGGAVQHRAP